MKWCSNCCWAGLLLGFFGSRSSSWCWSWCWCSSRSCSGGWWWWSATARIGSGSLLHDISLIHWSIPLLYDNWVRAARNTSQTFIACSRNEAIRFELLMLTCARFATVLIHCVLQLLVLFVAWICYSGDHAIHDRLEFRIVIRIPATKQGDVDVYFRSAVQAFSTILVGTLEYFLYSGFKLRFTKDPIALRWRRVISNPCCILT